MRIPRRLVVSMAAIVLVSLAALASALRPSPEPAGGLDEDASIVFVCRNGVAMSVWSALTFNRLAAERGLPVRAGSRAALSAYTEIPWRMRLALVLDGFRIAGYRPRVISTEDVQRAERVVLIDTALPETAPSRGAAIESWGGFPPMREEYFASRAALRARVEELVERIAASPTSSH